MIVLDPCATARGAVASKPDRAATALVHDSEDVRLVAFKLAPGQEVAAHRSTSTVTLTVLEGAGILTGGEGEHAVERRCTPGDVVAYAPNELHGMRAEGEQLLLLAAITPRPGTR